VSEDWYFVSHRLPLAMASLASGYEVLVVTNCTGHEERLRAMGLTIIPFQMDRRGLNLLGLLREVIGLSRLYAQWKPDIVHHVALRPLLVGGVAARLSGVKHVVSAVAGMGFLFIDADRLRPVRALVRLSLRWLLARGVTIVQNPDDAALLNQVGVAADSIRIIRGAGVDTQLFRPQPEPSGRIVVMLPARLLWDKGVGEFVEAARLLGDAARFVLVGMPDSDNPAAVPEGTIKAWVDAGLVEWWGHRNDMHEALNRAHIVCLPSYREGLPKALLEAMACGRPCIATDVAGCREAVRAGDNGLLVPPKDSVALAQAITRLIHDPALRQSMGRCGRERALTEFSQEKVIEATQEIYKSAAFRADPAPREPQRGDLQSERSSIFSKKKPGLLD
jgi:glycosyltransferase involved in cell wall biosynthesis